MGKKKTVVEADAALMSRAEVLEAVDAFRQSVAEWEATDGPLVQWGGHPTKALSKEVEEAAAGLFSTLATTAIQQDAWDLVLAVDRFELAMVHWWQRIEGRASDVDPQGGDAVWHPWNDVLHALDVRRRRQPEAIQSLLAQKVNHRQIAKQYGWYRDDGVTPDERMVLEEIQQPGLHYDPATYMHPSDKKYLAQLTKKWEERTERLGEAEGSPFQQAKDQQLRRSGGQAKIDRPPAPESIEELVRQGVPIVQVAKMKNCHPDEVRRTAAQMGVFYDPSVYQFVGTPKEQMDNRHKAEILKVNSHVEYGASLEDRVLAIADDGHPPGIIAQVLQANGFAQATPSVIENILLRAASEQEAAQA